MLPADPRGIYNPASSSAPPELSLFNSIKLSPISSVVAFISVGQAINHQKTFAKKKPGYSPVIPGNTAVSVVIPLSRENTIITAKATAEQVRQLTDGKIDTAGFMRLIKNSIETL